MILLRYFLHRVYLPSATPGGLLGIDGETVLAKTLELAWRGNAISADPALASCIPEGIYLVEWQPPKVSRDYAHFRFRHVPGRHWHSDIKASSCLIHRGNKVEHLLGCICPGSRHVDVGGVPNVVDSTKKLQWMVDNMPKAFELQIMKKP